MIFRGHTSSLEQLFQVIDVEIGTTGTNPEFCIASSFVL